jgi:hypothetical protein
MQYFERNNSRANKPPWSRIVFAVVLSIIGCIMITFSVLLFTQVIAEGVSVCHTPMITSDLQRNYRLTPYGLAMFGFLCIVPGVYHIVLACRGAAGMSSWEEWYYR